MGPSRPRAAPHRPIRACRVRAAGGEPQQARQAVVSQLAGVHCLEARRRHNTCGVLFLAYSMPRYDFVLLLEPTLEPPLEPVPAEVLVVGVQRGVSARGSDTGSSPNGGFSMVFSAMITCLLPWVTINKWPTLTPTGTYVKPPGRAPNPPASTLEEQVDDAVDIAPVGKNQASSFRRLGHPPPSRFGVGVFISSYMLYDLEAGLLGVQSLRNSRGTGLRQWVIWSTSDGRSGWTPAKIGGGMGEGGQGHAMGQALEMEGEPSSPAPERPKTKPFQQTPRGEAPLHVPPQPPAAAAVLSANDMAHRVTTKCRDTLTGRSGLP